MLIWELVACPPSHDPQPLNHWSPTMGSHRNLPGFIWNGEVWAGHTSDTGLGRKPPTPET
jgi:hypothetical protein